jgi:hypothetical protein
MKKKKKNVFPKKLDCKVHNLYLFTKSYKQNANVKQNYSDLNKYLSMSFKNQKIEEDILKTFPRYSRLE